MSGCVGKNWELGWPVVARAPRDRPAVERPDDISMDPRHATGGQPGGRVWYDDTDSAREVAVRPPGSLQYCFYSRATATSPRASPPLESRHSDCQDWLAAARRPRRRHAAIPPTPRFNRVGQWWGLTPPHRERRAAYALARRHVLATDGWGGVRRCRRRSRRCERPQRDDPTGGAAVAVHTYTRWVGGRQTAAVGGACMVWRAGGGGCALCCTGPCCMLFCPLPILGGHPANGEGCKGEGEVGVSWDRGGWVGGGGGWWGVVAAPAPTTSQRRRLVHSGRCTSNGVGRRDGC